MGDFLKKTGLVIFISLLCLSSSRGWIITDDLGRRTDIKLPIKSIISLSPAQTEIIYALGGADKLIAVSTACNYPPDVLTKEKAGSFISPDIEKIIALKPDIVFANGEQQIKTIQFLEKLGVKVVVFCPQNISGIEKNIQITGKLLENTKSANLLTEDIEKTISRMKPRKYLKTYVEIWGKPPLSIGKGSYISDALLKAGGINIYGDSISSYPKASPEEVIKRDPDVILLLYTPEPGYEKNSIFSLTKAGRTGNIFIIREKDMDLILRPGPRISKAMDIFSDILKMSIQKERLEINR